MKTFNVRLAETFLWDMTDITLYMDVTVFPGIGGEDSVVELTVNELEKLADPVSWVDVTL